MAYNHARSDHEILNHLDFTVMFVDECHSVKNEKANLYKALSSFKCKLRYGMTGTAVQNSYNELWAILHWVSPDELGSSSHYYQA